MEQIRKIQKEKEEKRKSFSIQAHSCFESFSNASYNERIEITKNLLSLFEENKEIIFSTYNTLYDKKAFFMLRNIILIKCCEFRKKKELREYCDIFLQKYFRCKKITKKNIQCKNIIKHTDPGILYNYTVKSMILLEKKEKNFSISLEEIEKLKLFRKNYTENIYCHIHCKN
jgi:hypothetical protein